MMSVLSEKSSSTPSELKLCSWLDFRKKSLILYEVHVRNVGDLDDRSDATYVQA